MPWGMEFDKTNRWVQKALVIPWDWAEERYMKNFIDKKTGNPAKHFRLLYGALLIKQDFNNISDEEVVQLISENPYMQYLCGIREFTSRLPFDASSLTRFRKRLSVEFMTELNELIVARSQEEEKKKIAPPGQTTPTVSDSELASALTTPNIHKTTKSDNQEIDKENLPENQGTLLIDATCAPQYIRYPQDASLLDEARRNLEDMIDDLHDPADGKKPRTYRIKARKQYVKFAKQKKKSKKSIRKAISQQLNYVKRDLEIINRYLSEGGKLSASQLIRLNTIKKLFEQQSFMHKNQTHQVKDRIVSLHQPHVRPIVRGKVKAPCEFGSKLDLSVTDGYVRLEHISFDAYNESENFEKIVEDYFLRYGFYPAKVLVDQLYRTKANLAYCKEWNISILGPPLGRPKKDSVPDKKQTRKDEIARVEVERKISLAKRSYGMGVIKARLKHTSFLSIIMSIITMNIERAALFLFSIFIFVYSKNIKYNFCYER